MFPTSPTEVAKKIQIQFGKDQHITPLCEIMTKYGSDKSGGETTHNYTLFYEPLFSPIRDKKFNIFECGIGSIDPNTLSNMSMFNPVGVHLGGSIFGWREYFPNAEVYTCDIDRSLVEKYKNEPRIHTYYCNQICDDCIEKFKKELGSDVKFDIIIDDGLHLFEANYVFLKNMYERLNPGGLYIIEDVDDRTYDYFFKRHIYEIRTQFPDADLNSFKIPHVNPNFINTLIILWKKPLEKKETTEVVPSKEVIESILPKETEIPEYMIPKEFPQ